MQICNNLSPTSLQVILTPVEVAIEDMRDKIKRLKEVTTNAQDTKLLQMQLQGGIATAVNQGPYAIAQAFLGDVPPSQQNHFHQQLRMCFREFVKLYVDSYIIKQPLCIHILTFLLICMCLHLHTMVLGIVRGCS